MTVVNPNNTITYTPNLDYQGPDTFNYLLQNSQGTSASGVVTITVQAPLPPVAVNDSKTTPFNTPVVVDVLANDSDPNSKPLMITMFTQPAHGTVSADPGGLKYTPGMAIPPFGAMPAPYVGNDSFTYTINDGFNSAVATVSITVQFPPAPLAVDDTANCFKDGNFVEIPVLANDTDNSGQGIQISSVSPPTNPAGQIPTPGTSATAEPSGGTSVVYTSADPSNAATYQSDTFTYTIRDVYGQTAQGKVTVTIIYP
jgi:hypothetical protein